MALLARGTTLAFDIPVYHKFSLQFRSANAASVHSCCHSNLVHANSSSNKFNPFRNIVQKPDACNRIAYIFNEFYNWFDLFYLLNYKTRSLSVLYIVCQNLHQSQSVQMEMAVGILVGLYLCWWWSQYCTMSL